MATDRTKRFGYRFRLGAAVAATALLAAACGSSGGSGGASAGDTNTASSSGGGIPNGPIKVGVILPLSGQLAGFGVGEKNAIEAFVNELNAGGGIEGHKLKFYAMNGNNDPATGVAAARKLAEEGVVATFAAGLGTVNDQVMPVLMKEKIINISNGGKDNFSLEPDKYPYSFSTEVIMKYDMKNMADYLKKLGVSKVGSITDGLPYDQVHEADFAAAAKEAGLDIVKSVSYSPTATSVVTQVKQLKDAGVEAISAAIETQYPAFYSALKQLNWNPYVIGNQTMPLSSPDQATTNTMYPCFGQVPSPSSPTPDGVAAAIKIIDGAGVKGVAPNIAPIYRDDVQLFAMAVKKANSINPDKVKAALETFRNVAPTSPGYSYTYTPTSHAGWASPNGQCRLIPASTAFNADGMPVQTKD